MADLKLDLFIKVLLMTTSDTDGEALAALRRANAMLRSANVDWDKLLRGKVTVVADPFANIPAPNTHKSSIKPKAPSPPRPPTPTPSYNRPIRPTYSPKQANNTNRFAGNCFACDTLVDIGHGALRDVPTYGAKIWCENCNFRVINGSLNMSDAVDQHTIRHNKKFQARAAASAPRTKRKVTTADLMVDIFFNDPKI